MTSRIQHIIDEINLKVSALHQKLKDERAKNMDQQNQISNLQGDISKLKKDLEERNLRLKNVEEELAVQRSQHVEVPGSLKRSDAEIEELVKEIDYCIQQLKK